MKLVPPVAYQGGKQRIAAQVVSHLLSHKTTTFYDLCCGSGAISIELVNQGISPTSIKMIDVGPWGTVWESVGKGTFDLSKFKDYTDSLPKEVSCIQGYIKELSKQPVTDIPYIFLLLQASSFGSKAIWIEGQKWMNCSFRSYWLPTAMSNRRSHVNPMMPMPATLYERMTLLCEHMRGVQGRCEDVFKTEIETGSVVYIDPPYVNTTFYGGNFDVRDLIPRIKDKCFVSESRPLSETAYKLAGTRKKGGISGERKNDNEEWLSEFN